MIKLIYNDVGSSSLSSRPRKCNGWAAAAAAADSLLGGLMSGLFSYNASSHVANVEADTAKQIAAENNAFNERQIDKMNDYNAAVNQRKRLEEAGLNPNIMMNGGSAGTQSQVATADPASANAVSATAAARQQGVSQMANSIAESSQQISNQIYNQAKQNADTHKSEADAANTDIRNMTEFAKNQAEIDKLMSETKYNSENWKNLSMINQVLNQSMADQVESYRLNNDKTRTEIAENAAQVELIKTNTAIQNENLKWLPKEKEAGLAQALAETALTIANKHLSEAEATNALASAAESYARQQGINIDNEVSRDTKQFAKKIVENSASLLGTQSKAAAQSYDDSQSPVNWFWRKTGISPNSAAGAVGGYAVGKGKMKLNAPKKVKGFSK